MSLAIVPAISKACAEADGIVNVVSAYDGFGRLSHGVMMVGPVGSGKSSAWRVLLDAMAKLDNVKGVGIRKIDLFLWRLYTVQCITSRQ